ncbi:MAG: mechanosensitive ion channel family protein [Chloroflexi bacterium]|nr:mechanosensitive ion channel family protein [Chloroflexota bacterium]
MQGFWDLLGEITAYDVSAIDPRIQAAIVVLVSAVVAKTADWIITRLLLRWVRRTENDFDDRLVEILHRPVFLLVLLGGLAVASTLLVLDGWAQTVTFGIFGTLAVFVVLVLAVRLNQLTLEGLSRNQERFRYVGQRTMPLFRNINNVLLVGIAAYFLLLVWDLDVTAWLASAGILGIAVGLGARDTVANFFAGVLILADAPYRVGDFIVLDTGERGQVTHIGLRSTRLLTRDDIEITIPNGIMGNIKVINETGGPHTKHRIRIRVGCAYGSDIDRVKQVLLEVAEGHGGVCRDPEPRVRFRTFGPSGLDLELLAWVDEPVLRGRVTDALNTEVYRRFADERIEIPYSKQDLYVKELPAPPGR